MIIKIRLLPDHQQRVHCHWPPVLHTNPCLQDALQKLSPAVVQDWTILDSTAVSLHPGRIYPSPVPWNHSSCWNRSVPRVLSGTMFSMEHCSQWNIMLCAILLTVPYVLYYQLRWRALFNSCIQLSLSKPLSTGRAFSVARHSPSTPWEKGPFLVYKVSQKIRPLHRVRDMNLDM